MSTERLIYFKFTPFPEGVVLSTYFWSVFSSGYYPGNVYLSKVNNRSTRERCEICSKLKTSGRSHWRRSVVFLFNCKYILHFLVFLLLTLNKKMLAGWCSDDVQKKCHITLGFCSDWCKKAVSLVLPELQRIPV